MDLITPDARAEAMKALGLATKDVVEVKMGVSEIVVTRIVRDDNGRPVFGIDGDAATSRQRFSVA
ncbi:hypothetical protein [Microbacterium allomyrinae]|uniref:Uncharacterized protein n=1 Tax=Microbacterium allomyrinae TaxID=2830666 RepID=A0A9X1LVY8_9MICO|nr:hypothetical protein [Microbacterium allomyrinae]MCC2033070.1 hypothetical protein [Microbacterium allomyrinae]